MANIINIDPYSVSSIYLEGFCNRRSISPATGFAWEVNGEYFLVSNWHVLSGRDPTTGQPLNKGGAVPDELAMALPDANNIGQWHTHSIKLIDKNNDETWFQHPSKGQEIDVAAIPLSLPPNTRVYPVNKQPDQPNMRVSVAQDVFVIGFPLGLVGGGAFPIWKKASVASEPEIDLDSLPKILLDTATRSGMSGSPVVVKGGSAYTTIEGGTAISGGMNYRLIGVYSGRIGEGELGAQLGICWKIRCVEEIIGAKALGDFKLKS